MNLRNYEIRGYYYETESKEFVSFVCRTSTCCNAFVARQYVMGKLNQYDNVVIDSIIRNIGAEAE